MILTGHHSPPFAAFKAIDFSNYTSTLAAAALVVLTGCSSYGFADASRVNGGDEPPAVHVTPVSAPAHLGLDEPALRTLLVDELEIRGLQIVSSPDVTTVRCRTDDRHASGFGDELVAEMVLACDILAPGEQRPISSLETTGLAAGVLDSDADLSAGALTGTRQIKTRAVIDAISTIGIDIAEQLRGNRDDSQY